MGIVITISLPARPLWPNWHGHWAKTSREAKKYREESGWAAKIAWQAAGNSKPCPSAMVRPVFHWPDKRKRDKDNALAAIKAALDGLQDAGIVEDDEFLRPQEPVFMLDREEPRLVLEIWEPET